MTGCLGVVANRNARDLPTHKSRHKVLHQKNWNTGASLGADPRAEGSGLKA